MSLTVEQARDAVMELVDAAWKATGAVTETMPLLYDDVRGDAPSAPSAGGRASPYGRATVRVLESPQSTQGRQRRYLTTGLVTVQVFAPVGEGRVTADRMARVVVDALRGHQGNPAGVWFFDVAPLELPNDGPWSQTNVQGSFRFQEVAT